MADPKSQAEQDAEYQRWLAEQPRQAPAETVPSDQTAAPAEVWPDSTELVALLCEAREHLDQHSVHPMKEKIDAELNGAWAEFGTGAADGTNTDFRFSTGLTEATEILVNGEAQDFEVIDGQIARLATAPDTGARVVARRLRREVAVGAVDGSNRDYTLASPILPETEIYVDGKAYPYDTVNARTVRLVRAPPVGSHVEAARVKKKAEPGSAGPKPVAPPTSAPTRVPPMEQAAAASQPPPTQ